MKGAATSTARSENNNSDDRRQAARKNKNINRKLINRRSLLDVSEYEGEYEGEAYWIYSTVTHDDDHGHCYAMYTSDLSESMCNAKHGTFGGI